MTDLREIAQLRAIDHTCKNCGERQQVKVESGYYAGDGVKQALLEARQEALREAAEIARSYKYEDPKHYRTGHCMCQNYIIGLIEKLLEDK